MRYKVSFLFVGLVLVLGPSVALTQFGQPGGFGGRGFGGRGSGGFGGGGFGSMDPSERWNQYTGGRSVWRRADITDPNQLSSFDRVARMVGSTNGEITRDQYMGMMQRFTQGRGGFNGMMPGGAPAGPMPGGGMAPGGTPMAGSAGQAPPAGSSPPGPWGGMPEMGGNQGGGFDPRAMFGRGGDRGGDRGGWNPEAIAEMMFRRSDQSGDGLLNFDEMSETLQAERDKYDTNKDGFIDINEFREYMKARMEARTANQGGDSDRGRGQQSANTTEDEEEVKRPVVYRAGKLPPNLPAWFRECERDGDGQVGLYEWKNAGRPLDAFSSVDLNGDGFVTAEEAIRGNRSSNATAQGGLGSTGPGSMAMMGPGGSFGSPGGGDPRSMFGRGGPGGGFDPRSMFGRGGDQGGGNGFDPRSMFGRGRGGDQGGGNGFDPRSMFGRGRGGDQGGGFDPRSMFGRDRGGDQGGGSDQRSGRRRP